MKTSSQATAAALLLLLCTAAVAAASDHKRPYASHLLTSRKLLQTVAGNAPSGLDTTTDQGTANPPPQAQPGGKNSDGGVAAADRTPAATDGDLAAASAPAPADAAPDPSPACNNAQSPQDKVTGTVWTADLSGQNNVQPNTTGVPAPLDTPANGTYTLTVDEQGQKASWALQLCNFQQYIASHLHSGSAKADYPPPLVPLEPFAKPADPLGPPTSLPQLCPPRSIDGCTYTSQGSFTATDISPLPRRPGDSEVPAVTSWTEFLSALQSGDIYVNVHTVSNPAGLIRGNLAPASAAQSAPGTGRATVGDSNQAAGSHRSTNSGSSDQGSSGPASFPSGVIFSSTPNLAAAYASASSGPSGTQTEQGTYTRGNANADANANANGGG